MVDQITGLRGAFAHAAADSGVRTRGQRRARNFVYADRPSSAPLPTLQTSLFYEPAHGSLCAQSCRPLLHPSLIFASLITCAHFFISAATKARNSSGVFSRTSTLSCLRRVAMSGWRSTALSPALSLLT